MKTEFSGYNCIDVFETGPRRTREGYSDPTIKRFKFMLVLEACRARPGSNVLNRFDASVVFYVMLHSQPEQFLIHTQQYNLHRTSVKIPAFNVFHRRAHVDKVKPMD
jgi:hypothetical protein